MESMDAYERFIKNAMVFKSLHSDKSTEEKYQMICDYLKEGGDVNAADHLDDDNTFLHVAVLHDDPDLIKKLLEKQAKVTIINRRGQTPIELAKSLADKANTKEVISLLENHFQHYHKVVKNVRSEVVLGKENLKFKKRKGTSGITGQLYETKLTSLVLFRALTDHEISKFYLGTNVDGVGDLDDVCLKYELQNDPTQRVIFIQAKHKDVPNKQKINLDDLKNNSSIFSLSKYFDSYMGVKNMFKKDNSDSMFRGDVNNVDCVLVLFTPAKSDIPSKYKICNTTSHQIKNVLRAQDIFKNMQDGNGSEDVFRINDTNLVLKSIVAKRIQALGELLKSSILCENDKRYSSLMSNELIKRYHVVLANKVISISGLKKRELRNSQTEKFREGTFYKDFLSTKDDLLLILKETIFQTIEPEDRHKYKPELFVFKLPESFGNIDLQVRKPQRVESLARDFVKLFKGTDSNIITIDENSFLKTNEEGVKVIEKGFVNLNGGIAGLVGNLLVVDNKTKMLKFNNIENLANGNAKKLLEVLLNDLKVEEQTLYGYRFDIHVVGFPTLLLDGDEQDLLLAKEFLSKFWFFTNQPMESQIEIGLKKDIERLYRLEDKNLLKVQSEAIYLRFHDAVQKWWLDQENAEYLTKKSDYLEKSKNITIGSSKLAILDFVFMNKINKNKIRLRDDALKVLCIQDFIKEQTNCIWNIIAPEMFFTMIKLAQYFDDNDATKITFLDVGYIIDENYLDIVETEIEDTTTMQTTRKVLVLIHNRPNDINKLCNMIKNIRRISKIKLIIVSEANIASEIESQCNEKIMTKTDQDVTLEDIINVGDISKDWVVQFYGQETKFDDVDVLKQSISSKILWKLINNEIVEVGKSVEKEASRVEKSLVKEASRVGKTLEKVARDDLHLKEVSRAARKIKKLRF